MTARKLGIALFLALAVALFVALDLGRFLTLEALKANHQRLLDLYAGHPLAVITSFMAIYIVQTALSLPGATVLSLAAGATFGFATGLPVVVTAATAGATLACLATRYLLRDLVHTRFGSRLAGLDRELEERGLNYLLFLRLVPLFPFFLINLAAGLTRMPLRTFVVGTLIGILPGAFVYINAGASLATVSTLHDIASPRFLGALALLGFFALLPALASHLTKRTKP